MKKTILISLSVVIIGSVVVYLKYRHDTLKEHEYQMKRIERVETMANGKLRLMQASGLHGDINADSLFQYYEKTTK